jgi:hypothetical protein
MTCRELKSYTLTYTQSHNALISQSVLAIIIRVSKIQIPAPPLKISYMPAAYAIGLADRIRPGKLHTDKSETSVGYLEESSF